MFQCFRLIYLIGLLCLFNSWTVSAQTQPAVSGKPPLEKVRLQLKWFHQFQFAGYYAAIQQGYYAEEGLDVELLERKLDQSVIEQVVTGDAEYGVGDSGLLHEYALGKPIVALAAIFQHNPLVFMTLQDSGIISPYEMKGKRIMLDQLNANEAPLKALLADAKLSDADFTLVRQSGDNTLLTRRQLDVMTGYLTDQPFYYKKNGVKINIINPQNYGVDFYGDILFTSENERQHHAQRINRFLRASLKGWQYALAHPQPIIALIANQYHSKLSLEHLQFEAKETRKLIPETVPLGYIDLARLKVLADTYAKASYNQSLDASKLNNFIYQSKAESLNLSDAEKVWLAEHPTIRVGINPNKQPYEWLDEKGQFVGMAADYLKLLEQKLDIHFTIVKSASLAETLEMAKRGEIDMLAGAVNTAERSTYLSFLNPYQESSNIIIDNGKHFFIDSLSNLTSKRVAVEKGYAIQEWLERDYPNIQLTEVKDTPSALQLVEEGEVDAYVGDAGAANYWIKKLGLFNLRFTGKTDYRSYRAIAISQQQPALLSIINKASAKIDQQQVDAIVNRWLSLQVEQGISETTVRKYGVSVLVLLLLFSAWIIRLNREITARQQVENREMRRNKVLNMLTSHQPLSVILHAIAADIDELNLDIACCILLLSDDGKHLQHGAAPRLPEWYCQAIDGIAIGPDVGSCGASAFSGVAMLIEDIQSHPNWEPFQDLTEQLPYRACWSQPFFSETQQVLGTFAIYHRYARKPNDSSLQLIDESSGLIALAIEKSKLDTELQLAASVFTHAREGIYITDKHGKIIDCNDTFLQISGYKREELIGQNPRMFKSGVHDEDFYRTMWQSLISVGFWSGEIWNKYKNSDKTPGLHSISVIRDKNQQIERFVALATDISALKHQQQKLEHFAYYDTLTGLPNRLLLIDRIEQATLKNQRYGHNLAVVFIDLDGFKAINDSYGHGVGDEFLVAISREMKQVIRESDTLGRLGGDEFIVLLNELENHDAYQKPLSKLLKICSMPIVLRGLELKVSASMGIRFYGSQFEKQLLNAETLIRQADQAMYVAKQSGKNSYHLFDDKVDQLLNTRYETIDHIQEGLRQNEFVLYYQPKVNMRTGELIGVEALIRWHHPQRGVLSPNVFLPMIESHPLSAEVGEWVLITALAQLDQWRAQGLTIPISINVDARQLNQHNFLERLTTLIAGYPDFQAGSLELEILETTAISDRKHANQLISDCESIGVGFALDDFGTGYSSLTYLRQLPVKTIKIDRSFISDIDNNPKDLAIVESMINLAFNLNRCLIAEGVETIKQGELLINRGCELGQGYAIANAMPADKIPDWVSTWQPDKAWSAAQVKPEMVSA
jgi:diguanylate cyclase (GGDEF)-like protein/PAS domain S-box-containing protein